MSKKWYVREANSSRWIDGDWAYFMKDNTWTGEKSRAKAFRTKKEATAFASEVLRRGTVYGE